MAASTTGANVACDDTLTPVKSEVLCFIASKAALMTFDDLVKVCDSFYRKDEVVEARSILEKLGVGMHKRKGDNMLRTTVEDITKVVLNPEHKLPTFYATDVNRLPPVDIKHVDVAAMLAEIQGLRSELRSMTHLQVEVIDLRNQVNELRQALSEWPVVSAVAADVRNKSQPKSAANTTVTARSESDGDTKSAASFAQRAGELRSSGMTEGPRRQKSGKTVIGTSVNNQRIKSVKTFRNVDIFVSRLHPCTVKEELVDCVDTVKGDIHIENITCTKLQSRYEHLYSSFWVSIRVDACVLKNAIDIFLSPDAWPSGVLARRYFVPKNDGSPGPTQ